MLDFILNLKNYINKYVIFSIISFTILTIILLHFREYNSLKSEYQNNQNKIKEYESFKQELNKNLKKIQESQNELNDRKKLLEGDLLELRKKLFRENNLKKSVEDIAESKPELLEKIINNGTKKTIDCLKSLSKESYDEKNCK